MFGVGNNYFIIIIKLHLFDQKYSKDSNIVKYYKFK